MATKRKRTSKAAAGMTRAMKFANARRREQRKRMEEANTTQQGNRANVRQNTTGQPPFRLTIINACSSSTPRCRWRMRSTD